MTGSRDNSRRRAEKPRREPMFLPDEGNGGQGGIDGRTHRRRPMRRRGPRVDKPGQAKGRPVGERLRKVEVKDRVESDARTQGCPLGMCAAAPSPIRDETQGSVHMEPIRDDQTVIDRPEIPAPNVLTSAVLCAAFTGVVVAGTAATAMAVWRLFHG